jgi:hypothetical protein
MGFDWRPDNEGEVGVVLEKKLGGRQAVLEKSWQSRRASPFNQWRRRSSQSTGWKR